MARYLVTRRPTGFTLIELLVVIAIIGVLAAILLPTITAVRCRAKEAACAAMVRDLESALKAYESDFARFPPNARAVAANAIDRDGEADNRTLVACLSGRGPRGSAYYQFRIEMLRRPMPGNFETASVATIGYTAFPEAMSPLGQPDGQFAAGAAGGTPGGSDRYVHNLFYRQPGVAFNRINGFELWTGACSINLAGTAGAPAPAPQPPASPVGNSVAEVEAKFGGAGNGRFFSKSNNWR
ncbi:MAG: type II secretion system protein [Planctomycetes bacterium]|nr:type II secretion system protein [Planctomycetota bacterium]